MARFRTAHGADAEPHRRRLHHGALAFKIGLVASILSTGVLALAAASTIGGFTAKIHNTTSTFGSGTVQLSENQSSTTCYSTGSGSGGTVNATNTGICTINIFAGATKQVPGGTAVSTTLKLANVGNVNASGGTVLAPSCTASATSTTDSGYKGTDTLGFCSKVDVTIQVTGATACIYPKSTVAACATSPSGTLTGLAAASTLILPAIAATGHITVVIKTQLATTAGNTNQGLKATVPITWAIHQ